jgi:hypothetical protein
VMKSVRPLSVIEGLLLIAIILIATCARIHWAKRCFYA